MSQSPALLIAKEQRLKLDVTFSCKISNLFNVNIQLWQARSMAAARALLARAWGDITLLEISVSPGPKSR